MEIVYFGIDKVFWYKMKPSYFFPSTLNFMYLAQFLLFMFLVHILLHDFNTQLRVILTHPTTKIIQRGVFNYFYDTSMASLLLISLARAHMSTCWYEHPQAWELVLCVFTVSRKPVYSSLVSSYPVPCLSWPKLICPAQGLRWFNQCCFNAFQSFLWLKWTGLEYFLLYVYVWGFCVVFLLEQVSCLGGVVSHGLVLEAYGCTRSNECFL